MNVKFYPIMKCVLLPLAFIVRKFSFRPNDAKLCVWWDLKRFLYYVFLSKHQSIDGNKCYFILDKMKPAIDQKHVELIRKKWQTILSRFPLVVCLIVKDRNLWRAMITYIFNRYGTKRRIFFASRHEGGTDANAFKFVRIND